MTLYLDMILKRLGALEAGEDIEREFVEAAHDLSINRLFYSF